MDHSEDLPIRCQLVNKSPRKVLDYISTWGKAEIVYLFRKTDMRKDSDMQSPVCENFSYIFENVGPHIYTCLSIENISNKIDHFENVTKYPTLSILGNNTAEFVQLIFLSFGILEAMVILV